MENTLFGSYKPEESGLFKETRAVWSIVMLKNKLTPVYKYTFYRHILIINHITYLNLCLKFSVVLRGR